MIKKILLLIFVFIFSVNLVLAKNLYDSSGHKIGSVRKTSTGYNVYDKSGAK